MTKSFIEQLAAYAALAPSADNTQPWQMRWSGSGLEIHYVARQPGANVFEADSHATLIAIGGLAENIDMVLAANGVHGRWNWSEQGQQPYGRLELPQALPENFTVPSGLILRHTNRLPFRAEPLARDLHDKVAFARQGQQRTLLLEDRTARQALVRLAKLSSQARFCNQELHQWLYDSLRKTPQEVARGDGLDMATLGLPPGGKAIMGLMSNWQRLVKLNRLGMYRLLATIEVGLVAAAPGLLCVVGSGKARDSIDAGRLLTRVWTLLNEHGAAVQPYYVVTDQINRLHAGKLAPGFERQIETVEQELHRLLKLERDDILHMIMRVGYPKQNAVRSRRLPLPQVYVRAGETSPGSVDKS